MTRREAYQTARSLIKSGGWEKAAIIERDTCHYGEYGIEYDVTAVDTLDDFRKDGWVVVEII